jgi:hypothetical protein
MTEIATQPGPLAEAAQSAISIEQIRGLLQDATAYAAATRPVVLHTPAEPATVAHPGIAVTYPATLAEQAPPAPSRRLYTRPELIFAAGVTSAFSTVVAGVAAGVMSSPMPLAAGAVAGIGASVAAAVAMTGDDDRAQLKAWRERRGGGQR